MLTLIVILQLANLAFQYYIARVSKQNFITSVQALHKANQRHK